MIGRDLLIRCRIGLEWRGDELLVATIPSPIRRGKLWEIPVFHSPVSADLVKNVDEVTLVGGEEKLVRVEGHGRAKENEMYVIRRLDTGRSEDIYVLDTAGHPKPYGADKWRSEVLVKNLSTSPRRLSPGSLKCAVSETCTEEEIVSLAEIDSNTTRGKWFKEYAAKNKMHCLLPAVSMPDKLQARMNAVQARVDLAEVTNMDEAEEDAEGLSIDNKKHQTIADCIPWAKIAKEHHGTMRELLVNKYPEIVSTGFWDIGDTSKTMGKVRLPYAKPGPAYPKVFPLPERKRVVLKTLINQMVEAGVARGPVNTNQGAPVFLVDRKDTSKPARMVVALTRENSCLADPPSVVLPSTDKILSKMGSNVYLISQIDLRQGFYHMKIDERDLHKSTIATPFGNYEILVCLMGWAIGPVLFQGHMTRTFFTDPRTGKPCDKLDPFLVLFLDDINIVSGWYGSHEASVKKHYEILDLVFHRMSFHGWKMNADKLVIAAKEAKILGWIVKDGKLFADPERVRGIVAAEFPQNRKGMMAFTALVGTLRRVLPKAAASELAKLYDLTSTKRDYAPTPEHRAAFEKCKQFLTSEPLFVELPDVSKVKILFSDSSSNIFGGVLAQIDFEALEVKKRAKSLPTEAKEFSKYDALGVYLQRLNEKALFIHKGVGGENKLVDVVIDQLGNMGARNYPHDSEEFLGSLSIQAQQLCHPDVSFIGKLIEQEKRWDCKLLRSIAMYVQRDVVYLVAAEGGAGTHFKFRGSSNSHEIPPIFVGAVISKGHERLSCYSLYFDQVSQFSEFTSLDSVVNDYRDLDQKELFEQVKRRLSLKQGDKPMLKIISYTSKIIPDNMLKRPIFEKEALGLLTTLHSTRDMHVGSPALLIILDSTTAYFLFAKGISETVHKVHRWSVTFQERYPNALLYAVPSAANIADFLSRNFEIGSKKEAASVDQLYQKVERKIRLEGEWKSTSEMREHVSNLPDQKETKMKKIGPILSAERDTGEHPLPEAGYVQNERIKSGWVQINAVSTRRTKRDEKSENLDRLNETLSPIKLLQDSLSNQGIGETQRTELTDKWEKAENGDTAELRVHHGLLQTKREDKWVVLIPPSLEGRILAYHHLISGHGLGRDKMFLQLKSLYSFPKMYYKCRVFVANCLNCKVVKGDRSRNNLQGTSPAADFVYQILYADLISGLPKNSLGYTDVLTIVCPLSKMLCTFGLKSAGHRGILESFKTFFQLTGFRTEVLYTDNGAGFRDKKLLQFMASIGVTVAATSAFNSKARGQIEVFNYLYEKVLKGLLLSKKDYSWADLGWLATVFINSTVNSVTKVTPYEAVFGLDFFKEQKLGLRLDKTRTPLIQDSSLRKQVEELRRQLEALCKRIQKNVETAKMKTYARDNRTRKTHDLEIDDIVFIKDHRLPTVGTSPKFRPTLQPSPFIISGISDHLVQVVRIVDRFTTRVNPDDVVKIPFDQPPLYEGLEEEILVELGKGLTDEVVERLTELDSLPLIGLGNPTSDEGKNGGEEESAKANSPLSPPEREEEIGDDAEDGAVVFENDDPALGEQGKTVRFENRSRQSQQN